MKTIINKIIYKGEIFFSSKENKDDKLIEYLIKNNRINSSYYSKILSLLNNSVSKNFYIDGIEVINSTNIKSIISDSGKLKQEFFFKNIKLYIIIYNKIKDFYNNKSLIFYFPIDSYKVNINEVLRTINRYLLKNPILNSSSRLLSNLNFFKSSSFKYYLNKKIDEKEKLLITNVKKTDFKKLYESIMNSIVILDIETYSDSLKLKKHERESELQNIYSIGILKIDLEHFNFIKKYSINHEKLLKIKNNTNLENRKLFKFSKNSKESLLINSLKKKIKILRFYNINEIEIKNNIKEIMNLILLHKKSTRYIYTFNGKSFDFFIIIKLLLKHIPEANIKDIIEVNKMIYGFTFSFNDENTKNQLEYYKKIKNSVNSENELKKFYSDSYIKYYETLVNNISLLNKKLIFRDITTIIPNISLKDVCLSLIPEENFLTKRNFDIVGFMKKIKNNTESKKDIYLHDIYLISDIVSLYSIIDLLFKELIINLNINPLQKFTIGSISMEYFKKHLRNKNINIYYTKDNLINNIIYNSIYGGRVFCNKPIFNVNLNTDCTNHNIYKNEDKYDDFLYELDVNSLYPFAMMSNKFPYDSKKFLIINLENYKSFLNDNIFFISYCIFKIPKKYILMHLPTRLESDKFKKSYMYVEKIENIFNSEDIKEMISLGYELKEIHGGIVWEQSDKIFESYINELYLKRFSENKVSNLIMKLMMNSLYGKFSQKPIKEEVSIINRNTFNHSILSNKRKHRDYRVYDLNLNYLLCYKTKSDFKYNYPVELSSFILSYSRSWMNKIICKFNGFENANFWYSDTDSIYVNKEVFNKLEKFISYKKEIGMLKIERIIKKGIFLGNKMKGIIDKEDNEKITFKGFKNLSFSDCIKIFKLNLNRSIREEENIVKEKKERGLLIHKYFKKDIKEGIIIKETEKEQRILGPVNGKLDLYNNTYIDKNHLS